MKHSKRPGNKNLYTLNESNHKNVLEEDVYSENQGSDVSDVSDFNAEEENLQDFERAHAKNQQLINKMHALKVKNRQLADLVQLSDKRNAKHEQKQRELIKKLSYQQVSNKQLQYEVKKLAEELLQFRQNKKSNDSKAWQVNQQLKKAAAQKNHFIAVLRKFCQVLLELDNRDDYVANASRIQQFARKNLKNVEGSDVMHYNFDMKFDVSRVSAFKQKSSYLEQSVKRLKQELEAERQEKKRIISTYNDKISKLREACEMLKLKVEQKEDNSHEQITHLKEIIQQKNQTIQDLKQRLDQSYHRREPGIPRKGRSAKKTYIGDGQYQNYELNNLQNQIEQLEKKLIRQLRD